MCLCDETGLSIECFRLRMKGQLNRRAFTQMDQTTVRIRSQSCLMPRQLNGERAVTTTKFCGVVDCSVCQALAGRAKCVRC